jgi:hypothetical protein
MTVLRFVGRLARLPVPVLRIRYFRQEMLHLPQFDPEPPGEAVRERRPEGQAAPMTFNELDKGSLQGMARDRNDEHAEDESNDLVAAELIQDVERSRWAGGLSRRSGREEKPDVGEQQDIGDYGDHQEPRPQSARERVHVLTRALTEQMPVVRRDKFFVFVNKPGELGAAVRAFRFARTSRRLPA